MVAEKIDSVLIINVYFRSIIVYHYPLLYNEPAAAVAAEKGRAVVTTLVFFTVAVVVCLLCSWMFVLTIIYHTTRHPRKEEYIQREKKGEELHDTKLRSIAYV